MNEELIRGYKNFLFNSVKLYFFERNIIQNEIDYYTSGHLKDGMLFFILAFDKIDPKLIKNIVLQNDTVFKEYILYDNEKFILQPKGIELKFYLEQKIESQAMMLEFNGIKPEYLGKITTILKRFEKFWYLMTGFSKKVK